jgi:cytochrome c
MGQLPALSQREGLCRYGAAFAMNWHAGRAISLTALLAACSEPTAPPGVAGDPVRGTLALTQYACHACHQIPGITGSEVYIGPVLKGFAGRRIIARDLPNTPENLARWIRDPQKIDPHTAMPALGVGEEDARDMVAYLLTLK